jgi:uncharacterized protein DUF1631
MKDNAGKHGARRAAAKAEPSPLTGLRDMLATAFAADIAAVTPAVIEVLRDETQGLASPERRALVRDAMVVLARNSAELALAIVRDFRARFDAKLVPGYDPLIRTSRFNAADLALVDEATLQLDIALDQCAARLREQTAAQLFQLTARVAELLGRDSLEDAVNPIVPRVFARTLIEALAQLGFHSGGQLAVFKAYGPALLHIAPDLYMHANGLLAERGVLADYQASHGQPVANRAAPERPRATPADAAALAEILDRLLNGGAAVRPILAR